MQFHRISSELSKGPIHVHSDGHELYEFSAVAELENDIKIKKNDENRFLKVSPEFTSTIF